MVLALSAGLTCVIFFSLRMRLAALVPSRWRLPECMRRSLPVAVSLKRLAAPRWVLSFLFGFEALRGIAKPFPLFQLRLVNKKYCRNPFLNQSLIEPT